VKPRREEGAVIAAVPAGIHILSPELKHKDAPMSLAEVTGDFEIQVRVAGGIRPGSSPLKDVPVPIAFQGAGLLVWQDPDNYLRFERAAMSGPSQPLTQKVIVEVCRDGKPSGHVYKDTSDRPVFLRLTRRGDDLECAYSPDGKTWLSVKKSEIALFPSKVRVGILASNLSPKPFNPRFDAFTLDQSGGKAGSR
jgi:regulation of enolase protein 1 (concanavalin A-like superfamily)